MVSPERSSVSSAVGSAATIGSVGNRGPLHSTAWKAPAGAAPGPRRSSVQAKRLLWTDSAGALFSCHKLHARDVVAPQRITRRLLITRGAVRLYTIAPCRAAGSTTTVLWATRRGPDPSR